MKDALQSEAASAGPVSAGASAPAGSIPEAASILEQARDAIVVLGLDGAVRYWNHAAERIFEWPAPEAMQRHAQDFLWADAHSVDDALSSTLARGEWTGDVAALTKSGGRKLVESRWSLLRDERTKSRSILTIHSDITEKTKTEDQAARLQQLETISALARGLAHDLNNVLGPIIMAADLFKLTMKSQRELDLLETVEVSARRGSEIVKQMLAFTKARPRDSETGSTIQASGGDDGVPRGHGELILLIDDEISIRLITGRTLEAYGYQVITASDGADGMAKYSAHRGEVALVITDMTMPVMSGAEIICALLKLEPSLKIVASSGANMKGAEAEAARNGVKLFLRKPYTVAQLLALLAEALN